MPSSCAPRDPRVKDGVKKKHFRISDPDMLIYYTTFIGLQRRLIKICLHAGIFTNTVTNYVMQRFAHRSLKSDSAANLGLNTTNHRYRASTFWIFHTPSNWNDHLFYTIIETAKLQKSLCFCGPAFLFEGTLRMTRRYIGNPRHHVTKFSA